MRKSEIDAGNTACKKILTYHGGGNMAIGILGRFVTLACTLLKTKPAAKAEDEYLYSRQQA